MQSITYTNELGQSLTFGDTPPFMFVDISGAGVGKTQESFKAIGVDGQTTGKPTLNERTILCNLILSTYGGVTAYRNNCNIMRSVFSPSLNGILSFTNEIGTYKIACSPFEVPIISQQQFSIQLIANNPYWQASEEISFRLGSIVGGFSFPFSFSPTVSFGTWVKSCTIENDMGVDTPFVIEMVTVSDYCQITNELGQFIKVDRPITEGQRLTINTANQEVRLYDVDGTYTLADNKVTLDSTYFKLHYGTNVLTLDNGQLTPAIATITYNKLYLGV